MSEHHDSIDFVCGNCEYWTIVLSVHSSIGECENQASRRHGYVLGKDCKVEGCFRRKKDKPDISGEEIHPARERNYDPTFITNELRNEDYRGSYMSNDHDVE